MQSEPDTTTPQQVQPVNIAAIQERLLDRCALHERSALRRSRQFKRAAATFRFCIPVFSAVLTFMITSQFARFETAIGFLGLCLTLLTILNSIMDPARKFRALTEECIELHDWRLELDMMLHRLQSAPPDKLHEYLLNKNEALSNIGRNMVGLAIPESSA